MTTLLYNLPLEAVASKPVGIMSVGGTQDDFYATDWDLRGVVVWTDAFSVPASVHMRTPKTPPESEMEELKQLANWVTETANAGHNEETIPSKEHER